MKYQLLFIYIAGQLGWGLTSTMQVISFDNKSQADEAFAAVPPKNIRVPGAFETVQVIKLYKETPSGD